MAEQMDEVMQYLKDCGCDAEDVSKYLVYVSENSITNQIFVLERHRKKLMDSLHSVQRMVDCTDFIIRKLEKDKQKTTRRSRG